MSRNGTIDSTESLARSHSALLCFALRLCAIAAAQSLNTAITQRHSSADRLIERATRRDTKKAHNNVGCWRRLTHWDFDYSHFFSSYFLSFPQENPASTSSHARPTAETSVSPSPRRFPPTPTRKRSARWVNNREEHDARFAVPPPPKLRSIAHLLSRNLARNSSAVMEGGGREERAPGPHHLG